MKSSQTKTADRENYDDRRGIGLDLDNIAKGILDGICGPVLSDDSQVTELVLRRVALSGFMGSNVAPPIVSALSKAVSENSEFVLVRAERDSWNGVL